MRLYRIHPTADDFHPGLLAIERQPPHPAARLILAMMLGLFGCLFLWAALGKLDIVAVAEGKLVPNSYLKIVQPSEAGIVKEILVQEGQRVAANEVLLRMDAVATKADREQVLVDYQAKDLALRRIDAQLTGKAFGKATDDPPELYAQTLAHYQANRHAHERAMAEARDTLDISRHELAAAEQIKAKLEEMLPHYREQEAAYSTLGKEGYATKLQVSEKIRDRIEKENDRETQSAVIRAAKATLAEAEQNLNRHEAEYRQQLQAERTETLTLLDKLKQELEKQEHRHELLELKSPQAGIVKDLVTHTPGTVVQPGTVLMTVVPDQEFLKAEVWVSNQDIGFVHANHPAQIKLAAYPFQKYGMLQGRVSQVSADAQENTSSPMTSQTSLMKDPQNLRYRTIIAINTQFLQGTAQTYKLTPGMQVTTEIQLGKRTVLEYLLSPVRKAFHEAGRER